MIPMGVEAKERELRLAKAKADWIHSAWELLKEHQHRGGDYGDAECPECQCTAGIGDGHEADCKLKQLLDQYDERSGVVGEVGA